MRNKLHSAFRGQGIIEGGHFSPDVQGLDVYDLS